MTEIDAQPDRQVSTGAELTRAQVVSDDGDLAAGLRGLAALVAGGRSLDELLTAVAGFAAHAIPGVDGAGVTLIEPRGTTMGIAAWAVTAPFVREIDILQHETLQEGPCTTCMQERVAVISGSLGGDHRWPRFGPRVGRLGVASSMSLPMLIADQVVGSVNCYAYDADVFGRHEVRWGRSSRHRRRCRCTTRR
ncbi:GAF domain-containing protein [Mycobacterium sp.]|uniref:GAF domain-containing protein n=1 Tax=Mycobacterium sp. TaxID=1785 RepID=UPI003D152A29